MSQVGLTLINLNSTSSNFDCDHSISQLYLLSNFSTIFFQTTGYQPKDIEQLEQSNYVLDWIQKFGLAVILTFNTFGLCDRYRWNAWWINIASLKQRFQGFNFACQKSDQCQTVLATFSKPVLISSQLVWVQLRSARNALRLKGLFVNRALWHCHRLHLVFALNQIICLVAVVLSNTVMFLMSTEMIAMISLIIHICSAQWI